MIASHSRRIDVDGHDAMLLVLRNNGFCWGRVVFTDDSNFDVEADTDLYDDSDETALDIFEPLASVRENLAPTDAWPFTFNEATGE